MKRPWQSKTNLVQLAAVLAVLTIPEVRRFVCDDPRFAVGVQALLTIFARNWRSDIAVKRKDFIPQLNLVKLDRGANDGSNSGN